MDRLRRQYKTNPSARYYSVRVPTDRQRERSWVKVDANLHDVAFQRQKPPGIRVQESQQGTSDAGKNKPEWRKYIEICKWHGHAWKKKLSNLPVQLTDSDATVERVCPRLLPTMPSTANGSPCSTSTSKYWTQLAQGGESGVYVFNFLI